MFVLVWGGDVVEIVLVGKDDQAVGLIIMVALGACVLRQSHLAASLIESLDAHIMEIIRSAADEQSIKSSYTQHLAACARLSQRSKHRASQGPGALCGVPRPCIGLTNCRHPRPSPPSP